MIHFHIISLFPEAIEAYLSVSILGRAQKNKHIKVSYYNPRDFTIDKHGRTDEKPYGGGPGMVMTAIPILRAVKKASGKKKNVGVILLSPQGKSFNQKDAKTFSEKYKDIILISGRYEGIDARVEKILKPKVISVGEYVLTGGELPSAIIIDAVSRNLKGVLGDEFSVEDKRIAGKDVYTRPQKLEWGKKSHAVPTVLMSGHHKKIEDFRKKSKK